MTFFKSGKNQEAQIRAELQKILDAPPSLESDLRELAEMPDPDDCGKDQSNGPNPQSADKNPS